MIGLTNLEKDIITDLLIHGDNLPSNIGDNTGRHPTSVSRQMADLEDMGFVRPKGHGVWCLTRKGLNAARILINSD